MLFAAQGTKLARHLNVGGMRLTERERRFENFQPRHSKSRSGCGFCSTWRQQWLWERLTGVPLDQISLQCSLFDLYLNRVFAHLPACSTARSISLMRE